MKNDLRAPEDAILREGCLVWPGADLEIWWIRWPRQRVNDDEGRPGISARRHCGGTAPPMRRAGPRTRRIALLLATSTSRVRGDCSG